MTAAGAAIITVITVGAGTATASSLTVAMGSATLGTEALAAVTTLTAQANIRLINNGGDIGKTLKDLGSKNSVRNLVASVVTVGLLSQVGTALNLKSDSTYFSDRLMNNFVNSVGSTLVQTTINGGSLEDVNYIAHKLVHALAGCIAGVIQKQCEVGAIGGL
ncbi:hypothetical protein BJI46_11965 [Acinetobacter qingfengensis]|uniref:DUF637 domain-containing protein n=1 Tax=Acinetobacter qingfengensis TaxID=1262585 RepID=A0A1E7RC24_9GAMM|nr:DUF637 domain-containing protein [Acinetobacter qingfengensis]OEY96898.1 hypothetical protein BJI46_11965 [Acinetobacter qingfengensis]